MDLSLALVPSQVMTAMRYLSFIFIASLVTLPTSLCAQVAVRDTLPAAQITARSEREIRSVGFKVFPVLRPGPMAHLRHMYEVVTSVATL